MLDRQIIHALIIDGRAPFSRIAAVVGVSEQTVARRYRRMHAAGVVRVVGLPDSQRLGQSDWVVRLAVRARRRRGRRATRWPAGPDTSWVQLTSGGTAITCVVKPADTPQPPTTCCCGSCPPAAGSSAISAHSVLHMFRGGVQPLARAPPMALTAGAGGGGWRRRAANARGAGARRSRPSVPATWR